MLGFKLTTTTNVLITACNSYEERDAWMGALRQAISALGGQGGVSEAEQGLRAGTISVDVRGGIDGNNNNTKEPAAELVHEFAGSKPMSPVTNQKVAICFDGGKGGAISLDSSALVDGVISVDVGVQDDVSEAERWAQAGTISVDVRGGISESNTGSAAEPVHEFAGSKPMSPVTNQKVADTNLDML
jgi:hypothetical protein